MSIGNEPWLRILWSDETIQMIYREWGNFYIKKQQLDKASAYYNKSLDLNDKDVKALYFRSKCFCEIAQTDKALKDAQAALKLKPYDVPLNLQFSDAYYDANEFEQCCISLQNNMKKFQGKKLKPFNERLEIVEFTCKNNLGPTVVPFAFKKSKAFLKVAENIAAKKIVEDRPLWKILREQEKCDVVSILEQKEELVHPREIERRKLTYKKFAQLYAKRTWVDMVFLSKLRYDKNLLLPQIPASTAFLKRQVFEKYDTAYKFIKMLHARDPCYNKSQQFCPSAKLAAKTKLAHLNYIQYNTRREMLIILATIKKLREERNIKELAAFINHKMGDRIIVKTNRVMPWKFEFMNEVYNTLALAYCDQLQMPYNIMEIKWVDRIMILLGLTPIRDKDQVHYVFGDKSTFQESDAPDYSYIAFKKRISRLEKWLKFSKISIERCYIYHEIARNNLEQGKFDDCVTIANKTMEEAKNCKNNIYLFLAKLMICKVNASQKKIEKNKIMLKKAIELSKILNSDRITHILELVDQLNNETIEMKLQASKSSQMSIASLKRRK